MKRMFTVAKRHSWSSGIIQACLTPGCRWQRTQKDDACGNATSRSLYAWGPNGFTAHKRVPPCRSKP